MLLVRFNDLIPLFLDEFFGENIFDSQNSNNKIRNSLRALSIQKNKDNFKVQDAAPEMKKDEFDIVLNNNILVISSEVKNENEVKSNDGSYTRREFNSTSFKRTITLPYSVDSKKIKAKYNKGVLNLEIQKREEAKEKLKRKIKISEVKS